jgi:UTP--glucose-1-phosphate uridylyltransferase
MKLKKAVITAAGKNQRTLPLQMLIDRDGATKSALCIVLEEILSAGISEMCVVVQPGDQDAYLVAAGEHARRLHFVEQREARGYGHAILCSQPFVGDEPFLHVVSDHLWVRTKDAKACAQQLVEVAEREDCAVSAVQATRESLLPNFGAVGGKRVQGQPRLYAIESVLEKPTPTEAEQALIVPGLRAGFYLCFFGMHVLTPGAMHLLASLANADTSPIYLSPVLADLAKRERYLALEVLGRRHDLGVNYGLTQAQIALALSGQDRAEMLTLLVELLAGRD